MPSERVQRRIDRLLDQAEDAADQRDWVAVLESVRAVLSADPENEDALTFRGMAEAAREGVEAESTSQTPATDHGEPSPAAVVESDDSPTSFASGSMILFW